MVNATIEAIPGAAQAWLTVEDDDPDGFHDLTHTYTLFAESRKKSDPTKRGRFNLGCKLVLAMCYEAEVISTTGAVVFDDEGRHSKPRRRREAGSIFRGRIALTRDELTDIENQIWKLFPPPNVTTNVRIHTGARLIEGELIAREMTTSFAATLQTEIADAEGFLRRGERKTTVQLYATVPGEALLCEMGLPVQSIDGPWHINVMQKLPLGLERDAVPPAFLSKLQTCVANTTAEYLKPEDFTAPWIAEVVQDKNVNAEVVEKYLRAKYGDKVVIDVPGSEGQESGRKAVANGYTVIRGGAEAGATWEKIKEHQLAQKATALFPPPRASSDFTELTLASLPPSNERLKDYAEGLAWRLLKKTILVRFIDGPSLGCKATWHRRGDNPSVLSFNLAHLGRDWFAKGPTVEVNELLIHELAHDRGDHLEEAFDDAMANLGAMMIKIALEEPSFFTQFQKYSIPHQPFAHY
jgi:hypothetical protein